MQQRFETMIEGKKYRVVLTHVGERPVAYVQSIRQMDDGTEVAALLSIRQHKAESRAISRFAKEIAAHLKG